MTTPTQHAAWDAEVDKLKNRLSVLSQSSLDGEDQKKLREIGLVQDRDWDGDRSDEGEDDGVGTGEEQVESDFVKAKQEAEDADEMRYDCKPPAVLFSLYPTAPFFPLLVVLIYAPPSELTSPIVFFYGTLMHPLVLTRVLGHQDPELEFQDAILLVSPDSLLLLPPASSSFSNRGRFR
jgi:hypothetical protein